MDDAYIALPPLPDEQTGHNGDETNEQYHTLLEVDSHGLSDVLERTKNRCERFSRWLIALYLLVCVFFLDTRDHKRINRYMHIEEEK